MFKTPQKILDANRRYRERNREAVLYHKKNTRLRRFGLEPSDLDALLKEQEHKCKICRKDIVRDGKQANSANIDHCHQCGQIRSLLCKRCNVLIGFIESNEPIFFKSMQYYFEHFVDHNKGIIP